MERYCAITSVTFAGGQLPLPVSVRLLRRAAALPAGGDDDAFATSVQLGPRSIVAEVRLRDVAAAEGLSLGQSGALVIGVSATRSGQNGRVIRLEQAVLTDVEIQYEQTAPAAARLVFSAQAADGAVDPFAAQEEQP